MSTASQAASPMADLISSAMLQAHEDGRRHFYGWEKRACRWIIDYRQKGGKAQINLWTATFIALNKDAIMSPGDAEINFNLRNFKEDQSDG